MPKAPLCIFHGNCPDGFASAWATWKAHPDVELFKGRYNEPPPFELANGRDVFVVDFSYPRTQLQELHSVCNTLTVLDHHKTAQADLEGLDYCTFDMERSGAGLTWDHFFPGQIRPWLINYVEDRDLWRFQLPNSEAISLRIRLTPHILEEYDRLSETPLGEVLNEGIGGLLYLKHYVSSALQNAYDIRGLFGDEETVRCVNVTYTGISDVLNGALAKGDVQVALGWFLSEAGDLYCSLRSTKPFDCSVYAKANGGGGHAQASGFRTPVTSRLGQQLLKQPQFAPTIGNPE